MRRAGRRRGRKSRAYIVSMSQRTLKAVPDDALLQSLQQLLSDSRGKEADIVAHIGEVDERRLFAREAYPSMFVYCTRALHLSEAEAYLRLTVARASREHPVLLDMLADGRLHLTGIVRLVPYLTLENREVLLERATHLSKREILELLAELFPRPDVPAVIRKLPTLPVAADASSPASTQTPGLELCPDRVVPAALPVLTPPAVVVPLAPARYKVQFTARKELHEKLERLRDLMRSKVPDGDLAVIIEVAVAEMLERLEARRFGAAKAPRAKPAAKRPSPGSRHIPAAVKRAVSDRDDRRCRYADEKGRRCASRARLEYHHRHPVAFGGETSPENVVLLCHAHHRLQTEHDYGVGRRGGSGKAAVAPTTAAHPTR
jgi:hypothetical protein